MTALKHRAEVHRLALAAGLILPEDVVSWAAHVSGSGAATDPAIQRLALLTTPTVSEVSGLLAEVRGSSDARMVIQRLFAAMQDHLHANPDKANVLTQILERMAAAGIAPDSAAEVRMWVFHEILTVAESRSPEEAAAVRDELAAFLRTYAPFSEG